MSTFHNVFTGRRTIYVAFVLVCNCSFLTTKSTLIDAYTESGQRVFLIQHAFKITTLESSDNIIVLHVFFSYLQYSCFLTESK